MLRSKPARIGVRLALRLRRNCFTRIDRYRFEYRSGRIHAQSASRNRSYLKRATVACLSALLFSIATNADAELNQGDIAIIFVNGSGDGFSYVNLNNTASGETVNWTDEGWGNTPPDTGFYTGETNNGSGLGFTAPTTRGTIGNISLSSGLGNSGESVLLYQGTLSGTVTAANAKLKYGINWGNAGWITSGSVASDTSYQPSTLKNGASVNTNFSVAVGATTSQYYSGTLSGTPTGMLAMIANPANWANNATTSNNTFVSARGGSPAFSIGTTMTLTWDNNGATSGTGGTGTWDAITANKWSSGGSFANNWVNSTSGNDQTALFNGTAGTVSVASGGVTASGLQFDVTGYTVQSNSITLAGSTPTITVTTAGQSATISSQLTGSDGLTTAGAGTLALSGSNNYSGTTTINAGTLQINGTTSGQGNFSFGTLTSSATVGGSGSIGLAASKSVNVTGASGSVLAILNPGAGGTTATLTVNGNSTTANNLVFGANSELLINTNGGSADKVVVNGQVSGASNASLTFNQVAGPTLGNYVLLTDTGSGLATAFGTVSGVPTNYRVLGNSVGSSEIDLTHKADETLTSPSPATIQIHANGTTTVSATLTNTAPSSSSSLAVSLSDNSSTLGTLGTFTGTGPVTAGNGTVTVGATFTAGATEGAGTWSLKNSDSNAVTTAASAGGAVNVYDLATAATSQTVNVGNVHQGSALAAAVSLTNTAPANATYSETLSSNGFSGTTSGFTTAGSVSGIAGGSSGSGTLTVGLGTGLAAGPASGTTTLALNSNAVNSSGLGTTARTAQTITITGGVFALASSSLPATVTLPIVHVGGTFSTQAVAISNMGTGGASFTEGLNATAGTPAGQASGSGSFTDLRVGAGTNSSIAVGLSGSTYTGSAGTVTGTVPVTLVSNGTIDGLASSSLTSQNITVNGQVNQYAQPKFTQAGGSGALTGSGTSYTLNFGTVTNSSGTYTANLAALNSFLSSYQDTLSGSFTTSGAPDFTLSGFTPFSGIGSGSSQTGLSVQFNSNTTHGSFTESLVFHPSSDNTNPSSTTLSDITLNLDALTASTPATISISLGSPATNGRFMQNQTYGGAVTGTIRDTASSGNSLNTAATGPSPNVTGSANVANLSTMANTVGPLSSTTYQADFASGRATGPQTITVSETDGAASNSPQSASVTVDVLAPRTVSASSVVFGPNLLSGATVSGTSNLTTTSGDDSSTTRVNVASTAAADANGVGGTGGSVTLFNGSQGAATRTIGGAITGFGTVSGTVNLTVTSAEAPGTNDTIAYSSVAVSYSAANVGNANADNSGTGSFSAATPLTATVLNGGSYAGLESKVISTVGSGGSGLVTPPTANGSFAKILAGTNNGANNGGTATVNMVWRTRDPNETNGSTTHPPIPNGVTTGLISDVVNLTGLELGGADPPNETDPFVLDMSYDPTLLPKHGAPGIESGAAHNGLIYEASLNPASGYWENAVVENFGNDAALNQTNFQGSYTTFLSTPVANGGGQGESLSQYIGAWGVDTANHEVWAAVDHNSEFVVVPEPASLLLAGIGLAGLCLIYRRKKAGKTNPKLAAS